MSRPDEPITEPPPAGEDDAYSAATKVGVMPDELMAKLRAEGLLPGDEPLPPRPSPPRPSSNFAGSRPSSAGAPAPSSGAWVEDIPVIGSEPPDEGGEGAAIPALGAPPLPRIEAASAAGVPPSPAKAVAVETPIAFSSTELAGAGAPGSLSPMAEGALPGGQRRGARLSRRGSIVLAAVVVLAFAIAALSYAR